VAYNVYSIEKIAKYSQEDIDRLLSDPGIIRNRLKINAVISNAQAVQQIQKEFGSFKNWLDKNNTLTKDEWVKLFKRHFKFVGGEIVNEFLMSTGYLPGAHDNTCYRWKELN
jgi:DNA-3-methyladenine glycosylase I